MDEVHEATRDPAMAILKLRLQGSYADVVCDPTTPRAKAEELHAIAQGAGWPELWAKHGLTFPTPGGPAPPQRSKSPQTPPEAPEPVPQHPQRLQSRLRTLRLRPSTAGRQAHLRALSGSP